tara:strand:+ start:1784 stop:2287 length:504 start_codon:yes stop_codon:yes gene_type:complete
VFSWLADWVSSTSLTEASRAFLGSASVVPPLVQTIHLSGVVLLTACVIFPSIGIFTASPVLFKYHQFRAYGFRCFWVAIGMMLSSGLPFFLARPYRYASNPVFSIKAGLLLVGLPLAIAVLLIYRRQLESRWYLKLLAVITIMVWVALILAGRWIAYSEYLFWPGDF